jgi:hypothetical protein
MMQKFRTIACLVVIATVKMLGIVAAVLIIGALFALAGAVLLLNAGGAADMLKKRVTSRYLGSLAPGFANSPAGFAVYARLLSAIGAIFLGIAIADRFVLVGLAVLVLGAVTFVVLSVIAVRGEIATYRALKR